MKVYLEVVRILESFVGDFSGMYLDCDHREREDIPFFARGAPS